MPESRWTNEQLEGFRAAASSLKLYRRAELVDEQNQKSLVKDLYVDPLPAEHIFRTILKPNTTFLIGRKGTGKSTLFQRVQYELRQMDSYASAYVDIKTIYESSITDSKIMASLGEEALSPEQIKQLKLYRAFIRAVIDAIKDEIKKKLKESTFWERIKANLTASVDDLFEALDELLEEADTTEFLSVIGIKKPQIHNTAEVTQSSKSESSFGMDISAKPGIKTTISSQDEAASKMAGDISYSDILMRVFNIKEIILQLKSILARVGVRHLYVFVDDFSELPEDAMAVIVNTLLGSVE